MNQIEIRGARENNLKSVDINIPKNKLVVFTGVSGSGKSSLIFDTVYAESQRQLSETFSSYQRSRMPKLSRPDLDSINNLSTPVIIDQKPMGSNARSTLGTYSDIHSFLRLLFSRAGVPSIGPGQYFSFNRPEGMCPDCKGMGIEMEVDPRGLLDYSKTLEDGAVLHPAYSPGKWYWKEMVHCGHFPANIAVKDFTTEQMENLLNARSLPYQKDRGFSSGEAYFDGIITTITRRFLGREKMDDLPKGYSDFFRKVPCKSCGGSRLNQDALGVLLADKNIHQLCTMELKDLYSFLDQIDHPMVLGLINEIQKRLQLMIQSGISYLSLDRSTSTLSGGEAQRVKLSKQLACDLTGLCYILDEPSVGLHARDVSRLVDMLKTLRDRGNTVLVVEHDPDIIVEADHIIDMGPSGGSGGGQLCFQGSVAELFQAETATGLGLRRNLVQHERDEAATGYLSINNASANNLKNISVDIPQGILCCISGVAGSGKSSLVHQEIRNRYPGAILLDQKPCTRNSRSTPLSYTKVFDQVRKEFAKGCSQSPSLFSFNSQGACPTCKGSGFLKMDMHFMEEIKMRCPDCHGKQFHQEVLEHRYKGLNIHEALSLTVDQAMEYFESPAILKQLAMLSKVGLGYLTLIQDMSSLSGGEAQRVRLARELNKKGEIYLFDEPTTGLHMQDIRLIEDLLIQLARQGNTVIVIEHNLEILWRADWIIDMGPEGGAAGGEILAQGKPEDIMECSHSLTGQWLKDFVYQKSAVTV